MRLPYWYVRKQSSSLAASSTAHTTTPEPDIPFKFLWNAPLGLKLGEDRPVESAWLGQHADNSSQYHMSCPDFVKIIRNTKSNRSWQHFIVGKSSPISHNEMYPRRELSRCTRCTHRFSYGSGHEIVSYAICQQNILKSYKYRGTTLPCPIRPKADAIMGAAPLP